MYRLTRNDCRLRGCACLPSFLPSFLPAQMTFPGADVLALLEEGSPPEFICMNEHYGLSFEKGEAGESYADGELTSDKVCVHEQEGKHCACTHSCCCVLCECLGWPPPSAWVSERRTAECRRFDKPVLVAVSRRRNRQTLCRSLELVAAGGRPTGWRGRC